MIEQILPLSEDIQKTKEVDPVMARCIMAVVYWQKKCDLSSQEANQLLLERMSRKTYKIVRNKYGVSKSEFDKHIDEMEKLFVEQMERQRNDHTNSS